MGSLAHGGQQIEKSIIGLSYKPETEPTVLNTVHGTQWSVTESTKWLQTNDTFTITVTVLLID